MNEPEYFDGMEAKYSPRYSPQFQVSPWTQALPVFADDAELRAKLADSSSYFNPADRQLSIGERLPLLERLAANLFVPRDSHISVARKILSHLTARYLDDPAHSYPMFSKDPVRPGKRLRTYAKNIPILGEPGLGKSLAIQRILGLIPQRIVHKRHDERDFTMTQVTYVVIHCPPSGGGLSLVSKILLELYRVLGISRAIVGTQTKLEEVLERDGRLAGLGMIGINNFDNILKGDGYSKEMMSAITNINETCGLPVVLSGTNRVFQVMKAFPEAARRLAGALPWKPVKLGKSWDGLLDQVFPFYLTQNAPTITVELKEYLFDFSKGNPDRLVACYANAQSNTISDNRETVTMADYAKAKKALYMMYPMWKGKTSSPASNSKNQGTHSPIASIENDPVPDMANVPD